MIMDVYSILHHFSDQNVFLKSGRTDGRTDSVSVDSSLIFLLTIVHLVNDVSVDKNL